MAVGFTPKHIEDLPLNELTQEQFLTLAIEAAKKLEWEVGYVSRAGLIAYTNNGIMNWNAEVRIKIENGSANIKSTSTGTDMFDLGKNKTTVNNFKIAFEQVKAGFTGETLDLKYQALQEKFVPEEEDLLKLPPPTTTEQITGFLSVFKPTKGFFITPVLIDLNIFIFILMALGGANIMLPDNETLLNWGANFRPLTLEGEWWRLLTNCFLHIGILHLLLNMYALLYIGVLLEPRLGRARFLSAYLLTGITASLTSLWWHDLTISAGASGAIFGMYGVFLAMLTTNLIEKAARKNLLASIAVFVGYNLIYGLKGGIDNAAHLGGLIGGLIIGYASIFSLKKPGEQRLKYTTIIVLTVLILFSSFAVYTRIPNDIGEYDKKMAVFSSNETMALEVYNLPKDTPNDKILYALKERGLYYWKENVSLLDEVGRLNLPVEVMVRNKKLKQYCEIRIKSFEIIARAIEEDTDQYKAQIEDYNKQIEKVIAELGNNEQQSK